MRCPTCGEIIANLKMHYRYHRDCGDQRATSAREVEGRRLVNAANRDRQATYTTAPQRVRAPRRSEAR